MVQAKTDDNTSSASLNASTSSTTGISQEQYAQLVSLLQQASLVAPASTSSGPASNNITISPLVASNISANEVSSSGIPFVSSPTTSIIDSGANEHISCTMSYFSAFYRIKPVKVTLPNGTSLIVSFVATVSFTSQFHLHHVLYSPHFHLNLISVAKLCDSLSCRLHFSLNQCLIQDNLSMKMIGLAKQVNGLYHYSPPAPASNLVSSFSSNKVCNSINSSSCNSYNIVPSDALWHFRLGHVSHSRLHTMSSLYPSIHINNKSVCDLCHFAKHKHLPFSVSPTNASSNFELIHFDIWRPISTASIHGHRYFLTILDDHSRFLWIILLKTEVEVSLHVKNFITMIQNQFHITPKYIRTDNGPKFLLHDFYASHGIVHQRSCVETPQQTGRVERKHQHILNFGRALLFQSKLPPAFWSYAILHVVFLINRVPTPILNNQSPYFILYD